MTTYFLRTCSIVMLLSSATILYGPGERQRVGAPIQLFDVWIRNDTKVVIKVIDKLFGPFGTRYQAFSLKPSEVRLIAWRGINAITSRSIHIQGACQGGSGLTNEIIIGNMPNATFTPGGQAPAGTYVITQPQLCLLDVTQEGARDAGSVRYPRALSLWDAVIENRTERVLQIIDQIDGPQGRFTHKQVLRRGQKATLTWSQYIDSAKTRKIMVWGTCEGASKSTNIVVISNTPDATFIPEGGSPGGNYVAIQTGPCSIAIIPASF